MNMDAAALDHRYNGERCKGDGGAFEGAGHSGEPFRASDGRETKSWEKKDTQAPGRRKEGGGRIR